MVNSKILTPKSEQRFSQQDETQTEFEMVKKQSFINKIISVFFKE